MKIEKKIIINNIKSKNSSEEKFPKIPNIKIKEGILLKSIKLSKDSSYDTEDDDIIEGKKDKSLMNKKVNKEKKNKINIKQIFRNNTEPELNFENTSINERNQKEEKEEKIIQEINKLLIEENSKNSKKVENQIKISRTNKLNLSQRGKINLDQKKINVLFEISENKDENVENNSEVESSIDKIKEKKVKKKEIIERNLIERKKSMIVSPRNLNFGYKSILRDKKATLRLKKLGNTFSDFII